MQYEFVVNGGVSIVLAPENEMEEHLLKQLMKQDNDLQEIRTTITVLSKTFKNGLIIGKKAPTKKDGDLSYRNSDLDGGKKEDDKEQKENL
jgi:hypothetical protein